MRVKLTAGRGVAGTLAMALLTVLTACGGPAAPTPPDGDGTREVRGQVILPAGHAIDLATLSVSTSLGTYPVSPDGTFVANLLGDDATELGAQTAAGELLLVGVTSGGEVELSVQSTAEALLYYLVGGMWLPAERQDDVRSLLKGSEQVLLITTQLEQALLAGGNNLVEPDDQMTAALAAAHAGIFGEASLDPATHTGSRQDGGMRLGPGTASTASYGTAMTSADFSVAPADADGGSIDI